MVMETLIRLVKWGNLTKVCLKICLDLASKEPATEIQSPEDMAAAEIQLPEDMVAEILVKLPVMSLLRLSLVCKSWRDLIIRNPHFGKNHLNSYKNTDPHDMVFIARFQYSPGSSFHEDILLTDHKPLRPLVSREMGYLRTVGSCNGIICLVGSDGLYEFHLYNPITRENLEHRLDNNNNNITFDEQCTKLGFGFDMSSDDYKLIRMDKNRAEIYRFLANTWTVLDHDQLEDYEFQRLYGQEGVFVSGFFNWWVKNPSGRECILIFDFQNETFGEIEFPNLSGRLFTKHMSVLDDSLSVCSFNYESCKHDVWVMREYRETESWTRIFSVALMPAGTATIPSVVTFWGHGANLAIAYNLMGKTNSSETYFVNVDEEDKGSIFSTQGNYYSGAVFRPTLTSFSSNP